jgi:glyoxylase-like metal-dependent hydrolase (beta-lactamase superfamily II)
MAMRVQKNKGQHMKSVAFIVFTMFIFQSCAHESIRSSSFTQEGASPLNIQLIDFGGINGYLVKNDVGFFLIDTGVSAKREELDQLLNRAGCRPENLKLIILTHGDVDHVNNCAHLREKYGTKIAMNRGDSEMVATGNMGSNRKAKPDKYSFMFRMIMFFSKDEKFETFKPDILLENDQSLLEYGLDARVIELKGHSEGSIGVLTAEGELFCGDLLINFGKPDYHFIIFEMPVAKKSVEKLKGLPIKTIYPGHGKPFSKAALLKVKSTTPQQAAELLVPYGMDVCGEYRRGKVRDAISALRIDVSEIASKNKAILDATDTVEMVGEEAVSRAKDLYQKSNAEKETKAR